MLQLGSLIFLLFCGLLVLPALGQTPLDPRLKNFLEDQQEKTQFDQRREAAKAKLKQEKLRQEQDYLKAQADYSVQKAKNQKKVKALELTSDYLDWVKDRLQDYQRSEIARQTYQRQKQQTKTQEGTLKTTLKEYGLDQEPPRVAWSQRKFGAMSSGGGSGGSSGFVPPVPLPPPSFNPSENIPPPDYFEPDVLPPPPDFDGGAGLPPPEFFDPPPVYDGGSTFDPGFGQ